MEACLGVFGADGTRTSINDISLFAEENITYEEFVSMDFVSPRAVSRVFLLPLAVEYLKEGSAKAEDSQPGPLTFPPCPQSLSPLYESHDLRHDFSKEK